MQIYIVMSREWNSIEGAFVKKENVESFIKDQGGPGRFYILTTIVDDFSVE